MDTNLETFEDFCDRYWRKLRFEKSVRPWREFCEQMRTEMSSPVTTSEAAGAGEGQYSLSGLPTDFVREALEKTIDMHGRRYAKP
jgi:hypothetical protein